MKRKLTLNGTSYQVVLPKAWVLLNKLENEIYVDYEQDNNGNLIILARNRDKRIT